MRPPAFRLDHAAGTDGRPQRRRLRVLPAVLLLAALAAGCRGGTPTSPDGATLAGAWAGDFSGQLVSGAGRANLMQDGETVTGDWAAPMPPALLAAGAPPGVDLAGPVSGTTSGTTAELAFALNAVFHSFVGPECGLTVNVTSFDATTLMADWTTNAGCQPPIVDTGTLTFTRQ